MSCTASLVAAVLTTVTVTGAGWGVVAAFANRRGPVPLGPGDVTVRLGIEHSMFEPSQLRVMEGTRVCFPGHYDYGMHDEVEVVPSA